MEIIKLETAKLVAKKSYNKPVLHHYDNGKLITPYLENGSSTDTDFRVDLDDLYDYYNHYQNCYNAPYQYEVMDWLRKEHNIHINIMWHCQPNDPVGFLYYIGRKKGDTYVIPTAELENLQETYKEALEQGLIHALNLI